MRSSLLVVLASCGSSGTVPAPPRPVAREAPASTDPRCTVDADYWTHSEPIDTRAPIVVVFGYDGWGGGADRPAIAVWPDGTILDDGKVGHISAARATELAHDVASRLRDVPPRLSLTEAFDTPSTMIAARDERRWRVVHVEGLAFRGVRALATVRAANARPDRSAPDAIVGALGALDPLDSVSRPDEYAPEELVLTAQRIPPNTGFAAEWPGQVLEWPRELPAPPVPKDPDNATFELVVTGANVDTASRLADEMFRDRRPVNIRGERWMFYVNEHYRGHDAVARALECADTEYVRRWNAEYAKP
jgi:hypothetical protein